MKFSRIVCLVGMLVLVRAAAAGAQTQLLAWDEDTWALPYVTGYAVTVDGVRTDYGLVPAGPNLACGCSIPVPFSGGFHTVVVSAYDGVVEALSAPLFVGPSANAGGPYTGESGIAITVNGSGSRAPTGWITNYTWQWGDGTSDTSSPSPTATHRYDSAGTFSVTLTMTDNAGAEASSTGVVTIALPPLPPPPSSTPRLAWDEDPASVPSIVGYAVTVDGVRTDYGLAPAGLDLTCGCSIPVPFSGGVHTVVVSAYDLHTEVESLPLIVGPSADAGGPYAGESGSAVTVDGGGSTAPTGWITTYTWQWGDGTSNTSSPSPTASHTYDSPGSFSVTLTAIDNAGAEVSSTAAMTIGSPSPPPTPPDPSGDVVIHASDIPATALHGNWISDSDGTSPAGIKLITPDDFGTTWSAEQLASPGDYIDIEFTADADTPYTLWLRLQASGNSTGNDAVWVQFSDALVNGLPAYPIGTTSGLLVILATDSSGYSLNGWGWQNTAYWQLEQPTTVTFPTSGVHTMRIHTREDGVQLDQIVLSPSRYLGVAPGSPTNDATIVLKN